MRWCPPIGEMYDSIAGGESTNQLNTQVRKLVIFYKGLFDVPAEHC